MAREPPMRRRVVVTVGERNRTWKRVDCLLLPRFLPGGRSRSTHMMVGLPIGVEVVAEKVHRKHFSAVRSFL